MRRRLIRPPILQAAIAAAEREMESAMSDAWDSWMAEINALREELSAARRELDRLRALSLDTTRDPTVTVH